MSDEQDSKKKAGEKSPTVSIGLAELQLILERNAEIMAKAMLESRKPYVRPEDLQNEEAFRKSTRENEERGKRALQAAQAQCPHLQGCNYLSDETGTKTSIIKHRTDLGDIIGLCTNCGRQFWPKDPDYLQQMQRKSQNRMSEAGRRNFIRVTDEQAESLRTPIPIPESVG